MQYDVIIVGGGPAGSSSAITLAKNGADVLLLEGKQMPRDKLCGEFVAPECFPTLERLGVMDQVFAASPQKITRLILTAASGRKVATSISDVSNRARFAISLSRSRFDQILLERAREVGAVCLEGHGVKHVLYDGGMPCGVEATTMADGRANRFEARMIVDASGRHSRLTVGRDERLGGQRGSRLYAFKAHLRGVEAIREQVELYFFAEGYGGLSRIENDLVNLCFIANEGTVREERRDLNQILERTLMQNPVARQRLSSAVPVGKWHSSGPLTFGRRLLSREGVIAVGDASGMIDPFTGTGIQIALRTGEMAAEAVIAAIKEGSGAGAGFSGDAHSRLTSTASNSDTPRLVENALSIYRHHYEEEFGRRLTASGWLRRVAFSPSVANGLAAMLAHTPWLAQRMVRAVSVSGPVVRD